MKPVSEFWLRCQRMGQERVLLMDDKATELIALGWREWAALPELGIRRLKCKVDTGARTSALHAFFVEEFREQGQRRLRFGVHPFQRRVDKETICEADIIDRRRVVDSGGHAEMRYVIQTEVEIGKHRWPIELTLTDRDTMRFRMLLGRTAIENRFVVDPAQSFLVGKHRKKRKLKTEE